MFVMSFFSISQDEIGLRGGLKVSEFKVGNTAFLSEEYT
jgi:hypothetical protein